MLSPLPTAPPPQQDNAPLLFSAHCTLPLYRLVTTRTVTAPPELLLEPSGHPAVKPYRDALVEDGIPLAQFAVDDLQAEHERLTGLGVTFTQPPTDIGNAWVAVFDDTCGNLIQLVAMKPDEG